MNKGGSKPKRKHLARHLGSYDAALLRPEFNGLPADPEDKEMQALADGLKAAYAAAEAGTKDVDPNVGKAFQVTMQEKAKQMFKKAIEDPNSDAAEMVYLFVFNAVATMEGDISDNFRVLDAERKHRSLLTQLAHQRSEIIRQKKELLEATLRANEQADTLIRARTEVTSARHKLESNEEVDMREMCGRIADIVGLRPPPQLIAEQSSAPAGVPLLKNG